MKRWIQSIELILYVVLICRINIVDSSDSQSNPTPSNPSPGAIRSLGTSDNSDQVNKIPIELNIGNKNTTKEISYTTENGLGIFTPRHNYAFNTIKASSCCLSGCCGSGTIIWSTNDPNHYAAKVTRDGVTCCSRLKSLSIISVKGKVKEYHKDGMGKSWKEGNSATSTGKIFGLNTNARELKEACQTLKKKCTDDVLKGFKEACGKLESAAGDLQSKSTEDKALDVIEKYNLLLTEYNKLSEEDKDKVKTDFEAVQKLYDSMLRNTKIKIKAKVLVEKANKHSQLKEPSEEMLDAVNTLITAEIRNKVSASDNLQEVYNTLGKEYNKVKDDINPEVQAAYDDLKLVYMASLSSSR